MVLLLFRSIYVIHLMVFSRLKYAYSLLLFEGYEFVANITLLFPQPSKTKKTIPAMDIAFL